MFGPIRRSYETQISCFLNNLISECIRNLELDSLATPAMIYERKSIDGNKYQKGSKNNHVVLRPKLEMNDRYICIYIYTEI